MPLCRPASNCRLWFCQWFPVGKSPAGRCRVGMASRIPRIDLHSQAPVLTDFDNGSLTRTADTPPHPALQPRTHPIPWDTAASCRQTPAATVLPQVRPRPAPAHCFPRTQERTTVQAVPIGRSRARAIQRLAWSMSTLHVESRASMSWVGRFAVVMCLPENVTRIERSLR